MPPTLIRAALVAALAAAGCASLIGFPDYGSMGSGGSGGGSSTTSSSSSGSGTTSGAGCTHGAPCYDGLDGTENVGVCKSGTVVCDGGVASCAGEVLPSVEHCATGTVDENCDGIATCTGQLRWVANGLYPFAAGRDGTVALVATQPAMAGAVTVAAVDAHGRPCWSAPKTFGTGGMLVPLGAAVVGGKHTAGGQPTQAICQGGAGAVASTIVHGYATGSIDFGHGVLPSSNANDAFIASLDATGAVAWAQLFGSTGDDFVAGVVESPDGGLYVTGRLGAAPQVFPCASVVDAGAPSESAFVAKLGADGKCAWSQLWSGNGQGTSLAVDATGNLYVAGTFTGTLNAGLNVFTATVANSTFVMKLGPDGTPTGLAAQFDTDNLSTPKLALGAQGSVFVLGNFLKSFDFGTSKCTPSSSGWTQGYLAQLNAGLGLATMHCLNSPVEVTPHGIAADGAGLILLSVSSASTVASMFGTLQPGGLMVAKLNLAADGLVWARSFGSTAGLAAAGIAVDGMGNVVLGGVPTSPVDLGGATVSALNTPFAFELAP